MIQDYCRWPQDCGRAVQDAVGWIQDCRRVIQDFGRWPQDRARAVQDVGSWIQDCRRVDVRIVLAGWGRAGFRCVALLFGRIASVIGCVTGIECAQVNPRGRTWNCRSWSCLTCAQQTWAG